MQNEEPTLALSLKTAFDQLETPTTNATQEYISPSGKFRIHFETTGSNRVPSDDFNSNGIPDYIEEVAEAADSSYQHEIDTLGFTDPIGANEVYDVFVQNLANIGAYGLTNNRTSGSYACNSNSPGTCIYIENDFLGYPPNTDPEGDVIGSIKVTMAHEFKHAIQFAQNNWQGNADRWAEMDATLMEEVVYDDVNDYYNYITGFSTDLFNFPSSSLTAGSYEDITWALYFYERFGPLFWTDVWEIIETNNNISLLEAIETELTNRGESYPAAILESYMWHYASGTEFSGLDYGFEERKEYPNPRVSATYTMLLPALTDSLPIQIFSARYYTLDNKFGSISDDYVKFDYFADTNTVHFGLIAYLPDSTTKIRTIIGNQNSLSGSIETDWLYSEIEKIGLIVMNSATESSKNNKYAFRFTDAITTNFAFRFTDYKPEEIELAQNFPNPFNPSTYIRVTIPVTQEVSLRVYDLLGRQIQTIYEGRLEEGFHNFEFKAANLASGVYIYRLEGNRGIKTKTMTLIK